MITGLKANKWEIIRDRDNKDLVWRVKNTLTDGSEVYINVDKGIRPEELNKCYLDLNENNILVIRKKNERLFDDKADILRVESIGGSPIKNINIFHPGTSIRYIKFSKHKSSAIIIVTYRKYFNTDGIISDNTYFKNDLRGVIQVQYENGTSQAIKADVYNNYVNKILSYEKENESEKLVNKISKIVPIKASITTTHINNIIYIQQDELDLGTAKAILNNFSLNTNTYKIVTNKEQLKTALHNNYLNEVYTIQLSDIKGESSIAKIISDQIKSINPFARYRISTIRINADKRKLSIVVLDKRNGAKS